jgi:GNAT superfamily N-acetyltransferase
VVGLQRVERGDIVEIVHMAEIIWRQHFPGIISDEQIDYMLAKFYSLEAVSEELEGGRVEYCFIFHDEERVGFCAFGLSEQEAVMKLYKLYVLPRFQRHGFGSEALHCIEERCRKQGCSMMTLAVNKRNSAAINAYRRKGFAIQESVAVDIGEGFVMDDYIMEKRLV